VTEGLWPLEGKVGVLSNDAEKHDLPSPSPNPAQILYSHGKSHGKIRELYFPNFVGTLN
jgi:hypothetical protein